MNKIMKLLTIILICSCYNNIFAQGTESQTTIKQQETTKTGGWYPIFFEVYDQTKVNSIISTIQQNHARRIVVLYDKNSLLADKIITNIQAKVNFVIERSQDVPQDTATTKYNHAQVVVTVFLKDSNGKN